jgi:hypothetical protein
MEFDFSYKGSSNVSSTSSSTSMNFVPDATREPTFFIAELRQKLEFREAISALHDVVVSDLRFKPKDKTAYKEWAASREQIDWQEVAAKRADVQAKIQPLQAELSELYKQRSNRWSPFYDARSRYYKYLYERDKDLWFVLDPVISVHPDEVFFECFSEDESITKFFKTSKNLNAARPILIIPIHFIKNFKRFAPTKQPNLRLIRAVLNSKQPTKIHLKRSKLICRIVGCVDFCKFHQR